MILCQDGCASASHSPPSLNAPVTSQNLLQATGHALGASLTFQALRMTPFLFQRGQGTGLLGLSTGCGTALQGNIWKSSLSLKNLDFASVS